MQRPSTHWRGDRSVRGFLAFHGALGAVALILCAGTLLTSGCAERQGRPSIVLIVIDTLRYDAVSAYGAVAGTTPNIDAMARDGLLFERAYAASPWTLPSHATIFSGLRVDEHRVGMPGQPQLAEEVVTIAEHLAEAGYETVAVSENVAVSDIFQLLQGFDRRWATHFDEKWNSVNVKATETVRDWLAQRDDHRPFFLFVNLLSPHDPYTIRPHNPFLAADVKESEVRLRPKHTNRLLCGSLPTEREVEILRGLYLGDVAQADRETAEILEALHNHLGDSSLLSIVTSDHGEYFGKRKLMGHYFGLNESVLRIPMVVHGLPQGGGTRVQEPVGLIDIAPTVLHWAGLDPPPQWRGRSLSESVAAPEEKRPPRSFASAYSDQFEHLPREWKGVMEPVNTDSLRKSCAKSDRVWGGMAALVRYPYKFHWFEEYPPELYDLSWDPEERSNQADIEPELVAEFTRRIEEIVVGTGVRHDGTAGSTELSEDGYQALKSLGYVE